MNASFKTAFALNHSVAAKLSNNGLRTKKRKKDQIAGLIISIVWECLTQIYNLVLGILFLLVLIQAKLFFVRVIALDIATCQWLLNKTNIEQQCRWTETRSLGPPVENIWGWKYRSVLLCTKMLCYNFAIHVQNTDYSWALCSQCHPSPSNSNK